MKHALVLAPFDSRHLDRLRREMQVTHESWLDTRRLYDPIALGARLASEDVSILVVESDFVFEELFEEAHPLEFVGVCRTATNHVEVEAATRHGVAVVHTPGRNAQAVAEHSLALMLSLARRIPTVHHYVQSGQWQDPTEPYMSMRGVELSGRTLGIVGLGAIGRRLASIGLALGMHVLAFDPYVSSSPNGVELVDLDDLMSRSDFVSIHVPSTPETESLIDSRRLALMKPTTFLVSASDASVVQQDALVEALRERHIAGAGLDVFESHPAPPNSPLLALDNVVLTPHVGGATEETIERHSAMMTDDILRFLHGQRPVHLVNPEVWERRG